MSVFVLDRSGKAVMPCSQKRARKMLADGRARVHRLVPFVIRLIDRRVADSTLQPLRIKLDPGSKMTGLALVRESEVINTDTDEIERSIAVLSLAEIVHRGRQISESLTARRQMRRTRRGRNTRYRAPKCLNRANKQKGWLAPSLQHRIDTTMSWVRRFKRWSPVVAISSELVRFDMQQMQNPEISGTEYQQGTLFGYEVREYLLEKWARACAYCDVNDVPLQIEHITPKARGGSDRVSNLTLACRCCNQNKAASPVEVFLAKDPKRLAKIKAQAKAPLRDAATVNSTRWALAAALKATGLPVELSTGGRTKFNRSRFEVPKTHALDAACVGAMESIKDWQRPSLVIKCTGRGSYQRTRLDKYGFPRGYLMKTKRVHGFGTGDVVKANVPKGVKAGAHVGRVAIRASGSFNIQTAAGVVQGIGHKNCRILQRADGFGYLQKSKIANKKEASQGRPTGVALSLPALKDRVSRAF